jgi:hypothetical protein
MATVVVPPAPSAELQAAEQEHAAVAGAPVADGASAAAIEPAARRAPLDLHARLAAGTERAACGAARSALQRSNRS